jgi:FlaA1/EpsC-like NDP-sugar epimerase
MIEVKPGDGQSSPILRQENDLEELTKDATFFAENYPHKLDVWQRNLQVIRKSGRRAVIWGASSKGVAFLTTLKIQDEIEYVVDINPHKQGTYMAGTGQQIVAPEFLRDYQPDVVIIMNPIYQSEIRQMTKKLGLTTDIVCA